MTLALLTLVSLVTGCSSSRPAARAVSKVGSTAASSSTSVAPSATLSPEQVSNSGLSSQLGPGPLDATKLTQLTQYFEDAVAAAYASGDADSLSHVLAGPMYDGNRATINLLNTKHKRNVFHVRVNKVDVDNSESTDPNREVFELTGELDVNHFTDATTGAILQQGFPGPKSIDFLLFFDFNPSNHTWYWTGEKDASAAASGTSGTS